MREEFAENRVYIKGVELRPEIVFECGQAFRFLPKDEGYQGVARGRAPVSYTHLNFLRKSFDFSGTPIRILIRERKEREQ